MGFSSLRIFAYSSQFLALTVRISLCNVPDVLKYIITFANDAIVIDRKLEPPSKPALNQVECVKPGVVH